MGYNYTSLIGLFDVPENIKNNTEEYQKLLVKLVLEFENSKDQLCFGEDNSSGSGGLGCGDQEWWIEAITLYSKKFPEITFEIFLSYWDYTMLNILRFKNGKKIFTKEYNFEENGISIDDNLQIFPKLTQECLWSSINNNITPYFINELVIDEECYFGETLDF